MHQKSQQVCFDGTIALYTHTSDRCHCDMNFSIYLPPQAQSGPVPVLYFLSGLTCDETNFTTKSGVQQFAAQHGLAIVAPDTSPRGTAVPDEAEAWDFGSGAGFYVDATQTPWNQHYNMYSYITQELPDLIAAHFPVNAHRQGIFGHSMGGHGALVCALRNPDKFHSVSAFAPIVAPSQCPWGEKAFTHYLGHDRATWKAYDATDLIQQSTFPTQILIDQGQADNFLTNQLKPELFEAACQRAGQDIDLRYRDGYDHSYYFIASFIAAHIHHHATILNT
ncbi:S-formylglutathione hydrolase [filamentous cyanobacterium LEGE 11480]|uniref:S-formylglutathione hydrolase n=1 Tax=Romeriopsis navalis LEGE 11480 TaxID=2777977 RepID=A0A928VR39_9CYAN|nr:S-formylglutathione hydrolase [Romeriopsis navalis]MBE9032202.1 S-formylglutathione hydrolase [Romeriopsis navalis LEGE 11480]